MNRHVIRLLFVMLSLAILAPCRAGEIHDAVLKRDLAAVERVLKREPGQANARIFPEYKTPLHLAVSQGDPAIVKRLLHAGADMAARDAYHVTPLARAIAIVDEEAFHEVAMTAVNGASALFAGVPLSDESKQTIVRGVAERQAADAIPAKEREARMDVLAAFLSRKPELNKGFPADWTPLHSAAAFSTPGVVELLLDAGANVNARHRAKHGRNQTPLHCAAVHRKDREVLDKLIAQGAQIEAADEFGNTALMLAAAAGSRENVAALLEHGARLDAENVKSVPVLARAAAGGDEIVRMIYEKGGRALVRDAKQDELFFSAVKHGSRLLVDLLLADGVDVNIQDEAGFTPLLTAVEFERAELAKLLLEKGADRNAVTKDGRNLMDVACIAGNAELVEELLVEAPEMFSDRMFARSILGGKVEVVKLLLPRADVNAVPAGWKDASGGNPTPLMVAIQGRRLLPKMNTNYDPLCCNPAPEDDYAEIVELLLERGAKVNASLPNGTAAIHMAAESCGERVMKALLKAGANPFARHALGTPMHSVASVGRVETAEVLLAAGADANAVNEAGDTPLHTAAFSGNDKVISFLIAQRISVHAKNQVNGATPLHYAARANFSDGVRLLLESGADPNARDVSGATPSFAV